MRITTRKGDVFCVEIEQSYKVFFQYIGNDMTQLNSSVIRVFKKHYSLDEEPVMDQIVCNGVSFYAHTILRVGIERGAWYKVGSHDDVGEEKNVRFRMFGDLDFSKINKSYRWYVWTMNQPLAFVGEMTDEYIDYNVGFVYSYLDIVEKIKTGYFLLKHID